ncbi:hypothetical protein AVEN_219768-1 [Araneus ventricosus]|uniref:Uncharacterized protein n=1 Tax=Araneus ventricosus TaxID=182803 RepID=A0A4Y2JWU3_ARAVE|nr:hypothetical protein AVEN_219768-1 [Araneus ventricosus]
MNFHTENITKGYSSLWLSSSIRTKRSFLNQCIPLWASVGYAREPSSTSTHRIPSTSQHVSKRPCSWNRTCFKLLHAAERKLALETPTSSLHATRRGSPQMSKTPGRVVMLCRHSKVRRHFTIHSSPVVYMRLRAVRVVLHAVPSDNNSQTSNRVVMLY